MTGEPLGAQRVEPAQPAHSATSDPFPTGMQRFGAASGIGAAVFLFLAIAFSSGEFPDFGAPATEWLAFADEESDGLALSAVCMALAALELVFFAGYVRDAVGEAEVRARGHARLAFIVLGGMVFAATCLALAAAVQAAWAAQSGDTEPEIAKVFGQLAGALIVAASPGFAAFLLAAGLLILRTRGLPAWVGILALISALFFFLSIFFLLDVGDDENIFGFGFFLGYVTVMIWLIAASVLLIRRIGPGNAGPRA